MDSKCPPLICAITVILVFLACLTNNYMCINEQFPIYGICEKFGSSVLSLFLDLPDLVPDLSQFQSSLVRVPYLSRMPMYYLTCALEEGCLSSSARGKPFDHYRYISCLFTQFKFLIVDAIHLRWLTTCDLQEKMP